MGKYLDLDDVAAGNPRAERELAEMRERIAELEAALHPFAAEAREWSSANADDYIPVIGDRGDVPDPARFTVGDLRRAAALDRRPYTPEMSGSGQFGICVKCGLGPTLDGHDGCLGELPRDIVMNACCGHGKRRAACIQYWDGTVIEGPAAIEEQRRLKCSSEN